MLGGLPSSREAGWWAVATKSGVTYFLAGGNGGLVGGGGQRWADDCALRHDTQTIKSSVYGYETQEIQN